ncbi:MAG: branched-chain amino acid ABC transporter permease [Deltaproteobacteria bacterium]|nr:branched-chain amino acid ABC transporter permease [Deltaproteobacteria bacterium]MBW2153974.1 branched-chain amino acid ABC transporter permease [Deltaproteobacteria bacterium]
MLSGIRTMLNKLSSAKWVVLAGLLILLICLPMVLKGAYYRHILVFTLMYVVLAQAWNLIGGYVGMIALGNAVFFAIGAYTSTILTLHLDMSPWIGIWIGGAMGALVSVAFGLAVLRLEGHYFAMATIALGEITRIVFSNWKFLGGAQGISLPIRTPSVYYMQWTDKVPYYYIILSMAVMVTLLVALLDRSRFGFYSKAVKMDEIAARNRGINSLLLKLIAFALSAFITAMVGTFYAQYIMYISPSSILLLAISILIAVIPIVGGVGTVSGPILGAIFIFPLTEFLRAYFGGLAMGINYILFGAAAIFVVMIEPNGLRALLARFKHALVRQVLK